MLGAVWAHPGTEEGLCWPEESTSYMENGSTATGPLHCPHPVSPLPFPSSLPAPKSGHRAPEVTASAELWGVHAFLFRGMQIRVFCPDSFSTLSIYGKQNCMERQRTEMPGAHSWVYCSYRHFMPSPCHVTPVPAGQAVQAALSQQLQHLIIIIR